MQDNVFYDISTICRCCLKNVGQMKHLYGFSLDEMFRTITGLVVEPNDGLPEHICFQCVLQLSRAFRFKQQCLKSNAIIYEYTRSSACKTIECMSPTQDGQGEVLFFDGQDALQHGNDAEIICEDDLDSSSIIQDSSNNTAQCEQSFSKSQFECQVCGKQFPSRKQVVRHAKTHSETKPHKCPHCEKTFAERGNLKKHVYTHTGELRNIPGKYHLCSVCGNSFKYASSLSKHMRFHTGKNLLYCPNCPKHFAEKSALEIHMRSHSGDRPHACTHCVGRFTSASSLRKHIRSHSTDHQLIKCNICHQSIADRKDIQKHMKTHNSEKKALCNVCGKRLANVKTLLAHLQTHSANRPYVCGFENCNKAFTRHDTLLIHRRIHSGERSYSCNVCAHSFTTSTQLSNHERTHTGEKPFECEYCLKKFASRHGLKIHAKKHSEPKEECQQENVDQLEVSNDNLIVFKQDESLQHSDTLTEEVLDETVMLFKINENGELVPETECASMEHVSVV